MADEIIMVDQSDGIAVVTLNRPQALNALNRELRCAIGDTFRTLQADGNVGVAILTGAGRAFCAGVDLKELATAASNPLDDSATAMRGALEAFDRPLIGAINGFAITGGFELALMCDLLIASPEARFADTHARVGVVPGWGLSQRLARWIGIGRAKELSFTGNYLTAEQAERWGLVNRIVPADTLVPSCRALARDMLSCDGGVVSEIKRLIDTGYAGTLREGLRIEDEAAQAHIRSMSRADVAKRRADVQARGRAQAEPST
jgi:enoyl-CoA hydratase